MLVSKGVFKTGASDPLRDVPGRYIHVQVAGKYDRRVYFVALGILKSLVQLSTPESIVPSIRERSPACPRRGPWSRWSRQPEGRSQHSERRSG